MGEKVGVVLPLLYRRAEKGSGHQAMAEQSPASAYWLSASW